MKFAREASLVVVLAIAAIAGPGSAAASAAEFHAPKGATVIGNSFEGPTFKLQGGTTFSCNTAKSVMTGQE